MKTTTLSPGERNRARGSLFLFTGLNVIAFTLLSGNIITLYVLRLGADNFLVGLLSSFMYSAYLFLFLGRQIARKWSMVTVMGRFWLLRYLLMLPILATPFLASRGYIQLSYTFIVFSVLGFNAARGVAIAAYNPILGEIASGKDRGSFLARLQAIAHSITLILAVAMAFVLGRKDSLYIYILFILTGIASGLVAAALIFRFPEPAAAEKTVRKTLFRDFIEAFSTSTFRTFLILHFLTSLLIYMVAPFVVVYFKRVYQQPDDAILYFLVFGSLGAVLMALVSGFFIDRVGAKPIYFLFYSIFTVVLIPMVISPPLNDGWKTWIFACLVLLFFNMGQFGILSAGQTYFLSAIKPEDRLNLGVIYFTALGAAGAIGSVLGGGILEILDGVAPTIILLQRFFGLQASIFQIYFGGIVLLSIVLLFFLNAIKDLGAYPIRDVMLAIFSPRDLRAISLLNRLSRVRSLDEEQKTLRALGKAYSELSPQDVLSRLRSPRFSIRAEALRALAGMPLSEVARQALISEVRNHAFTTAYLAADIMGRRGIANGIPALQRSLNSHDIFLCGKSMVALARLNDRSSLPAIRRIAAHTSNPRLLIHAATALEIYRDLEGVEVLIDKLKEKTQPYVRDEIILSLAGILGFGEWFYPVYMSFLESAGTGIASIGDTFEEARRCSVPKQLLGELLSRLPYRNKSLFAALAVELLESTADQSGGDISGFLSSAILDPRLIKLERFLFLVAALIVWRACRREG